MRTTTKTSYIEVEEWKKKAVEVNCSGWCPLKVPRTTPNLIAVKRGERSAPIKPPALSLGPEHSLAPLASSTEYLTRRLDEMSRSFQLLADLESSNLPTWMDHDKAWALFLTDTQTQAIATLQRTNSAKHASLDARPPGTTAGTVSSSQPPSCSILPCSVVVSCIHGPLASDTGA